jgi:Aspartyl protease
MTSRARRVLAAFLLPFAPLILLGAGAKGPPKPDPRAWPAVYEPVDLSVADLRSKGRAATGKPASGRDSYRITFRVRANGLDGIEHIVWRDDDYLDATTLGPSRTIEGRRYRREWAQNENGYTRMFHGVHIRPQADVLAVSTVGTIDVTERVAGRLRVPSDVYVIASGPKEHPTRRIFVDAATYRTVREEFQDLGRLVVVSYQDYRTADGVTYPWHVTAEDGRTANDVVYDIVKLEAGPVVEDYELAISGNRAAPVTLPIGVDTVRLPARIKDGNLIVRLDVDGRGLDFELDSGSSGVLIDRDVAAQLKLASYGHRADVTAGPYTSSQVILPHASANGVTITNLVATAAPFHYDHDKNTTIVGLLGYDFIAGFVIRIDYEHGTIDAIRPSTFELPPNGIILDAALDDAVPTVSLAINGVVGTRFILDTGADDFIIFPTFADAHKDAVKDDSRFQMTSRSFKVVVASGVGGRLYMHGVELKDTYFGNVHYPKLFAVVLYHGQEDFSGEDYDGLIGIPLLTAYTVYLDYAHDRVVLVPNSRVQMPGKPK